MVKNVLGEYVFLREDVKYTVRELYSFLMSSEFTTLNPTPQQVIPLDELQEMFTTKFGFSLK